MLEGALFTVIELKRKITYDNIWQLHNYNNNSYVV